MGFWERRSVFFRKKHPIFLKPINVAYFMQNSFQKVFLLNLLKTFEIWGFMWENQWFFQQIKSVEDSKSINLAKFSWDASRKVELRKTSHYFMFWVIIWKNRGIFSRKNFKSFIFFQSPKLGLSYLESVTKSIFVLDYSKLSMSGTLCRNIELF